MNRENKKIVAEQHFVPRFYLKRFSNENNVLNIFDTEKRKRKRPKGAGGLCFDKFFYGAKTGTYDDISQEIETFFKSQVEDPIGRKMNSLIDTILSGNQLIDTDKYTLAFFVSNLWLRNPAMRHQINKIEEEMVRKMTELQYSSPRIIKELKEIEESEGVCISDDDRNDLIEQMRNGEYELEQGNSSHLRFMFNEKNIIGFTNLFYGQYWKIHISKTDRMFITSDNPVTVLFPERKSFFGATFLERTHLFPLTPNILIEGIYPINRTGKKIKRKIYFKGDEEKIDDFNLKIASQAREIYATREEEIRWFEEYVRVKNDLNDKTVEMLIKSSKL